MILFNSFLFKWNPAEMNVDLTDDRTRWSKWLNVFQEFQGGGELFSAYAE